MREAMRWMAGWFVVCQVACGGTESVARQQLGDGGTAEMSVAQTTTRVSVGSGGQPEPDGPLKVDAAHAGGSGGSAAQEAGPPMATGGMIPVDAGAAADAAQVVKCDAGPDLDKNGVADICQPCTAVFTEPSGKQTLYNCEEYFWHVVTAMVPDTIFASHAGYCRNGTCVACAGTMRDCDANPANGCERPVGGTQNDCRGCDYRCNEPTVCAGDRPGDEPSSWRCKIP